MTCKINADTSDGLKLISDTSGSIDLQSNGNTDISFASNALNIKSGTTLTIDSGATIANSGTATGFVGKVVKMVASSDNLSYTISVTGGNNSDGAGSKAYSITPSSSSNKVKIDFFIPQIRLLANVSGIRMRLYRQIGGGGYSHVTALSGDAASNRRGALAGNYDQGGDGNRSTVWLGGTIVDTPNTTSQVDYKFYFGVGDSGSHTIYVNRTQNDADQTYTHRTRTHCCLSEIDTS